MCQKSPIVRRREVLVYVAISIYCIALFLKRVSIPINQNMCNKAMMFATIIAVGNMVLDLKMSVSQWLLSIAIGLGLLIDSLPSGNHELLYLFLIIWSCRNVAKRQLVKHVFLILLVMTGGVAALTVIGVVPNEAFIQNEVRVRYGLGYNLWSILPFQYLALCMMNLYLSKKINIWKVIFMSVGAWLIYIFSDVKSAFAFTVLMIFAIYFASYIHIHRWNKTIWLIFLPEILTALSLLLTYFYLIKNTLMEKINMALNNRLMYQAIGLKMYNIGLLANKDVEYIAENASYFGIDNNYLNLLVKWGCLGLGIFLFIYSYLIMYCIKKRDLKLLVIVIVMSFIGMTWSRLLVLIEAGYLICFAELFNSHIKSGLKSSM